jgi:hypothetical protein
MADQGATSEVTATETEGASSAVTAIIETEGASSTAMATAAETVDAPVIAVATATAMENVSPVDIHRALTESKAELASLHRAHTKAGGGKGSGRWKAADHQRKKELEEKISQLHAQAAALPVLALPVDTVAEAAAPPAAQEAPVMEAQGVRLFHSRSSATGYAGVKRVGNRFHARAPKYQGKEEFLGCYDTAVEAAVIYAQKVATLQAGKGLAYGSGQAPQLLQQPAAQGADEAGGSGELQADVVPQAEGGLGAEPLADGGAAEPTAEGSAAEPMAGDGATTPAAVPVAVPVAAPAAASAGALAAASAATSAAEPADEPADEPAAAGAAASGLVTFAEGLQLHLTHRSNTGYRGVRYNPVQNKARPYQARGSINKVATHLGFFGTALEAAVAYAKWVARQESGEPEPERPPKVDMSTLTTHADGLELHLSATSSSGYRNVYPVPPAKRSRKRERGNFYVLSRAGGKNKVRATATPRCSFQPSRLTLPTRPTTHLPCMSLHSLGSSATLRPAWRQPSAMRATCGRAMRRRLAAPRCRAVRSRGRAHRRWKRLRWSSRSQSMAMRRSRASPLQWRRPSSVEVHLMAARRRDSVSGVPEVAQCTMRGDPAYHWRRERCRLCATVQLD